MHLKMNRRTFIGVSAAAAAGQCLGSNPQAAEAGPRSGSPLGEASADAMILVWLPGGIAHSEMWDPKPYTPFRSGMKGSGLLSTCGPIPTAASGVLLGKGLEQLASVMDKGTVLRTVVSDSPSRAAHLTAQYQMVTGYGFPPSAKAPSIGSIVSRSLGPKSPVVPPYIYIGRDRVARNPEQRFIQAYIGAGFYGPMHAPLMIPDPSAADSMLRRPEGAPNLARIDRRLNYLRTIGSLGPSSLNASPKFAEYMDAMTGARALLDSPVQQALRYLTEESAQTVQAYEPGIPSNALPGKPYSRGLRFGHGLLVARRLIERGARFVQVEYPFERRSGFDTHENGAERMIEMKRRIDGPIARLVRDLDDAGLLARTLVVVTSEFGRTIGRGTEETSASETGADRRTGDDLIIESEKAYGFHSHFGGSNSMLFFGGGFKRGFAYGKTADLHPMAPTENAVPLRDVHATIFKALGIPANTAYSVSGRDFYVTEDGRGNPVDALLA